MFATVLLLGGLLFAQAPAATDASAELSEIQDVELQLVRFVIDGTTVAVSPGVSITLTFGKGGQLSGRSAVNRYAGTFTATPDGKFAIQLTSATQMAGPPELIKLERSYFDALPRVRQVRRKANRVTLGDETISLEFAFKRAR